MSYDTKILKPTPVNIMEAANWLQKGEVIGFPTETVYGLAANALSVEAVRKIFQAKERPEDNPLIIHISNIHMLSQIISVVPPLAYKLAQKFWPGPFTMILPKKDAVPSITSGGLSTVGVRFPAHETAISIIEAAGFPLAAPSANLSGAPSPTTASHVWQDMNGKIPVIIDGGPCKIGLESTVVSVIDDVIHVLRPGAISVEDLCNITDHVEMDTSILNPIHSDAAVSSPGMKYRHYSPKAKIIIVESDLEKFSAFMRQFDNKKNVWAMVFDSDTVDFPCPYLTYGSQPKDQARALFGCLRKLDDLGAETAYVRSPEKGGVGLAVYNRLLRAAGFEVIHL